MLRFVSLLPADVLLDLKWWGHNAYEHYGVPLQKPVNTLSVTTDASRSGWGAICDGRHTAGQWSTLESTFPINTLELLAIFFAVQAFCRSEHHKLIKVFSDNTTALAYLNNMGGMVCELDKISINI